MRVVHIFKDFYPPKVGGIEQHMHLLCRTLAEKIDVCVLVPSRSRKTIEEHVDGIRVVRVPEFGRYASAPLCPTLPFWLRRLRPDVVHVHFPNPMGDIGFLLSGVRAPLVVTYHADIVKQRRLLPLYRPVLKLFFERAARIIAASPDYIASSSLLSTFRDRTVVIPYGVDTSRIASRNGDSHAADAIRRQYANGVVLFVGVLRYYKGVDVLLRAMKNVRGHAVIVGGDGGDGTFRKLAETLGVTDKVTFAGEMPDADLRVLFHAASVFVLPSIDRCEAFGIVQLEAMACGIPVVSTDLPTGVRYVNQHQVTGLIVPPGDADALAGALNRLLDDEPLRRQFGEAGARRVSANFTAERMVADTLDVYRDVLGKNAVR